MTPGRLTEILTAARNQRLLVIGDLMLDEFVWGRVGRISPEAPVPVVEVTGESFYPGGAANVARNLREFTSGVEVAGMIGKDRGGRHLRELLQEQKIGTGLVVENSDFPTIVKTRIIARQQQVVRVDREQVRRPDDQQIRDFIERVQDVLGKTDAIIFEDYGKGFLAQELVRDISREARAAGKIVTADPNPRHQIDWSGLTAVKPNRSEAFLAAGLPCEDGDIPPLADTPLLEVGRILLEKWRAESLLITLGEQGMLLFRDKAPPHHVPTRARQVFDVSGAGDTAIALFTVALASGASAEEAAEIANHASAVVVGKLGTATVTPDELERSFREVR